MDLTNAIKSGKRFKRKSWTGSMWLEYLDDTPSKDFLEQVSRVQMHDPATLRDLVAKEIGL